MDAAVRKQQLKNWIENIGNTMLDEFHKEDQGI